MLRTFLQINFYFPTLSHSDQTGGSHFLTEIQVNEEYFFSVEVYYGSQFCIFIVYYHILFRQPLSNV